MRIFVGIGLSEQVRAKVTRFIEGISGFTPEARWAQPESLHITLKFIGEQKPEQVVSITERLRHVRVDPFEIRLAGWGFFPTPNAPRVFWIGIHADAPLADLAAQVDAAVAELGIPREDRPYSPHLTLARGTVHARSGHRQSSSGDPKRQSTDGPNLTFAVLQKRLATMGDIDFGTMTADMFILYRSQLSPKGSQYTKLECFPLCPAQGV
jgi:2'-5' RNA ligase